ncbi:hypothetical protein AMTRI_Chr13g90070 [Amborella trichopoda]
MCGHVVRTLVRAGTCARSFTNSGTCACRCGTVTSCRLFSYVRECCRLSSYVRVSVRALFLRVATYAGTYAGSTSVWAHVRALVSVGTCASSFEHSGTCVSYMWARVGAIPYVRAMVRALRAWGHSRTFMTCAGT